MRKIAKQYFIASVHDDYMDRIEQIADKLRSRGCEISEVLSLSGVITGRALPQVDLTDLKIEGIASVEKQRILKKK